MLIAQALCNNIKGNKLAQMLASSGFKDTTRLALSNTQMAEDMVNLNNDNIKLSVEMLNESVKELLSGDYRSKIEQIKSFRSNLYS